MDPRSNAALDSAQNESWPEGLLIAVFSAVIILIVRMGVYERPMDQFFWDNGGNQLVDFFSYYKMMLILICGGLALVVILFRVLSHSMNFHKSFAYIPMAVYAFFILLSYVMSDYKEFSLLGYNDRFEGTLTLLCYLILLFFVINRINTERDVKWVIMPLAVSSILLSFLGLSQALDHDFFRTAFGKKLITPTWFWDKIDNLNFTFQNKEIYQTVYNINYVSFYLTLLIPLFGMLFIRADKLRSKLFWGALFTLLIFNLIGSESSGGYFGMAVVVLLGIIILNKRIFSWWKSVVILLILTLAVGGATYDRWSLEMNSALSHLYPAAVTETTGNISADQGSSPAAGSTRPYIDYIKTSDNTVTFSLNGEPLTATVIANTDGSFKSYALTDKDKKKLQLVPSGQNGILTINDARFFKYATVSYASDGTSYYLLVNTQDKQWPFKIVGDKLLYLNDLGKTVSLQPVSAYGFKDNQGFGSGRGYIWSRSIPLLKDTVFIGHGADTYCLYFPQNDYAGKYDAKWNINMIVDKPHNMYLGVAIGTGILSLLALLALFGIYIVQSILIYFKADFKKSFVIYVGAGIFLGISGFLATGLVDDSSVSTMPMFYALLGTGIAINRMIKRSSAAGI